MGKGGGELVSGRWICHIHRPVSGCEINGLANTLTAPERRRPAGAGVTCSERECCYHDGELFPAIGTEMESLIRGSWISRLVYKLQAR